MKLPDLIQSNVPITTDGKFPESTGFQTREEASYRVQVNQALAGSYSEAGPVTSNTVTTSPATIAALTRQTVHIIGGTVSALTFTRGAIALPLAPIAGGQFIDLSPGDTLAITFSVAPTIRTFTR